MALYAISDLHLALSTDKPMDIFGEKWIGHDEKIRKNWIEKIKDTDTVLIAGDISWSMKHDDSKKDLDWVDDLPGKKIISKGNHDYWWCSISKLNAMYKNTKFIQNNFFTYKDYAICGTRGWGKTENNTAEQDKKIIAREEIRLRNSLEAGKKIQDENLKNGRKKDIIVALHFPPFISNFVNIMDEYGVKTCIYGHLHGYGHSMVKEGLIGNIEYKFVGCDYTGFKLIKLSK